MIKVCLDTSTINFLFADDAPEKKEITIDFFDNFLLPKIYDAYVSTYVIQEIAQTNDELKRKKLLDVITKYQINLLELESYEEIENLADIYLAEKAIPENKRVDALHVAFSVLQKMDYLVSWNYKHLANVKRESKIIAINLSNNILHPIRILTPIELIDYEN